MPLTFNVARLMVAQTTVAPAASPVGSVDFALKAIANNPLLGNAVPKISNAVQDSAFNVPQWSGDNSIGPFIAFQRRQSIISATLSRSTLSSYVGIGTSNGISSFGNAAALVSQAVTNLPPVTNGITASQSPHGLVVQSADIPNTIQTFLPSTLNFSGGLSQRSLIQDDYRGALGPWPYGYLTNYLPVSTGALTNVSAIGRSYTTTDFPLVDAAMWAALDSAAGAGYDYYVAGGLSDSYVLSLPSYDADRIATAADDTYLSIPFILAPVKMATGTNKSWATSLFNASNKGAGGSALRQLVISASYISRLTAPVTFELKLTTQGSWSSSTPVTSGTFSVYMKVIISPSADQGTLYIPQLIYDFAG